MNKRNLKVFFVSGALALLTAASASAATLSWTSEPFEEKYTIRGTGDQNIWSVSDGIRTRYIGADAQEKFQVMSLGAKAINSSYLLLELPEQLKESKNIIDTNGNKIMEDGLIPEKIINDNHVLVSKEGKFGIYELSSKSLVAPVEYTWYSNTNNTSGYVLLKKEDQTFAIYNMKARKLIQLDGKYQVNNESNKYLSFASSSGARGFMNSYGNVVVAPDDNFTVMYRNDSLYSLTDKTTGKVVYKDYAGNEVYTVPQADYSIYPIIPSDGDEVKALVYDTTGPYDRLCGLMDLNGNVITEEKYYGIGMPMANSNTLIVSTGMQKYGLIDISGKEILPIQYNDMRYKGEGRVYAVSDGTYERKIYDLLGNVVFPKGDYQISNENALNGMYYICSSNGLKGLVDINGNIIIPFEYKQMEEFNSSLLKVSQDGEIWGLMDLAGNMLLPCQYKSIISSGSKSLVSETILTCDAQTGAYRFARIDNLYGGPISVKINGVALEFDQPPVIQNDRTLVPLRAIFEALNATVNWDGATQTVTAQKADTTISLKIGDTKLKVGDKTETLDVPAQVINDRTMVPARAVSEALSCTVDWDSDTKTVLISQ